MEVFFIIVGIIIFLMFVFGGKGDKIRCHSCGYRAYESSFHRDKCPSCGSLEL